MTRRVRAARLVAHGQPLQVQEIELANPSDAEVLVDLAYGGLNPVDRYAIEGKVAADGPLPRTIGGEATGFLDGSPVLVAGAGLGSTRDGLFAEAAVVPREAVFPLPGSLALDEAAGLGVVGMTAVRVVDIAEVGADDRVLVLGGSGGVGQSAISYAASRGAQVWGQTTSPGKTDAIREFGAKDAIVADAATLADAVRDLEPTVVIDPLGGAFTASVVPVLALRARIVLFGTSAGAEAAMPLQQLYRRGIQLRTFAGLIATREERHEGISRAITALAEGRLRIRVGARVPLPDVNSAFDTLAARDVPGKVVVTLKS